MVQTDGIRQMAWGPRTVDDDRYILISADCHGGGALTDYRPYLPRKLHAEFDAWADSYEITFDDLKGELGERNWDSKRRQADMEADGVVARIHVQTGQAVQKGMVLVELAAP